MIKSLNNHDAVGKTASYKSRYGGVDIVVKQVYLIPNPDEYYVLSTNNVPYRLKELKVNY